MSDNTVEFSTDDGKHITVNLTQGSVDVFDNDVFIGSLKDCNPTVAAAGALMALTLYELIAVLTEPEEILEDVMEEA